MAEQTIAEQKEETAEALKRLHAQVATIATSDEWTAYLKMVARFHDYSPQNVMWMLCQWYERQGLTAWMNAVTGGAIAPLADFSRPAAFSAWEGFGRKVKKGEKALTVLAPIVITDRDAPPKADGKQPTKVVGFRLKSRTFDVAQTEGEPLVENPVQCHKLTGEAPEGMIDAVTAVAEANGFRVEIRHLSEHPEANGFCRFGDKLIVVREGMSEAQTLKTLVHETAHSLMHSDRVNINRPEVEVEAESVAYVVLDALGVVADEYSIGYVATWGRGDGALIAKTAERVLKCAQIILDALDGEPLRTMAPNKAQDLPEGSEPTGSTLTTAA